MRARNRLYIELSLSALSGILLAVAFPRVDLSFLAWVSLVPLLLVMSRRPFLCGYVAGFAFFSATLYWLNIVMVTFGRLHPLLSLVAYILLVGYLALFFAVPTWLAQRLRDRLDYPYALTLPVIWVAFELLRGVILTGFPWVLLGYSQHENLLLIQSADLFGVYAISGLIMLANCGAAALLERPARSGPRFRQWRYVTLLVALLAANYLYGMFRLQHSFDEGKSVRVALVQGNIDQSVKWAAGNQMHTINTYRRLSRNVAADGVDLIVWPESATPFYLQERSLLQKAVLELTLSMGSHLLTGSPAYEKKDAGYRYYNSAFMIAPDGTFTGRSDKVHLVPFGEYVPFGRFLPFIDKLVYGIGDFSAGDINPLDFIDGTVGVLVCYEAIFPELARAYANAGSSLLVNITNDAWFGMSSAPYQHLAMARFRSIENRRWLVRAANTGISAIVDPTGHVVASSPLFETTAMSGTVRLLTRTTPYSRFGDVLPVLFLLVTGLWLWQSRLRK